MATVIRNTQIYRLLGELFRYPDNQLRSQAEQCFQVLRADYPEGARFFEEFRAKIVKFEDAELEEIYTRTFDIAPVCVPYVTAYIYGGESFERGDMMSKLLDVYSKYSFDTRSELPDHISVLLRFAQHLNEDEMADLVKWCLRKPLKDMIMSLESGQNIYLPLLKAVSSVLDQDFPERSDD